MDNEWEKIKAFTKQNMAVHQVQDPLDWQNL